MVSPGDAVIEMAKWSEYTSKAAWWMHKRIRTGEACDGKGKVDLSFPTWERSNQIQSAVRPERQKPPETDGIFPNLVIVF